ncbi:CHAT domain-containing protein [Streptomyces sp. NPDC006984]|uniref:CHAT domain-containing protein n=1 Tax=Streptomyces sp. NPDC006984 TaxID=3155463 RepID=UPI003405E7D8
MTVFPAPAFEPDHPLPPPPDDSPYDASRWDRDLLLTRARQTPAHSPEASTNWLELGLLCGERLAKGLDPAQAEYDHALARAALERGLGQGLAHGGPPVDRAARGHLVLAELLLEADGEPPPTEVDRAEALVAAVDGLPAGSVEDEVAWGARLHLADIAALRWHRTGSEGHRAQATARYTTALRGQPPLPPLLAAATHAALADLIADRAMAERDIPQLAAAAEHFARAVTPDTEPGERARLTGARGITLLEQGQLTGDTTLLRRAETALSTAAALAWELAEDPGMAQPPEPPGEDGFSWTERARRSDVLAAVAAVLAWRMDGEAEPAHALVPGVRSLVTSPGHLAEAEPDELTTLAVFLLDHLTPAAADAEEREHAFRVLREAAGRWGPDRDNAHAPHLMLATRVLNLSAGRPAELLATSRHASRVLELTSDPDPVLAAHLLRAVAHATLLEAGGNTADPRAADVRKAATAGTGASADPARWAATVERLVGPTETVGELFRRWQQGTGRDGHHAGRARFLLRHASVLDPTRKVLTEDRIRALVDAGGPRAGEPSRHSHLALGAALGHYGALHTGPLLAQAAEAAEAALRDDPQRGMSAAQTAGVAGMAATLRTLHGLMNGGYDDIDAGVRELEALGRRLEAIPAAERAGLPDPAALQRLMDIVRLYRAESSPQERVAAIAAMDPRDIGLHGDHPAWHALTAALRRSRSPEGAPPSPGAAPSAREIILSTAGMPPLQRASWLLLAGTARVSEATASGDRAARRDVTTLILAARETATRGDDVWLAGGMLLGFAGCQDAVLGRPWSRRRRLDEAIGHLEEVYRECRGPEHPWRGRSGLLLAKALRLRGEQAQGDRAAGRRVAAEALRATAYAVLLQSGTADAASAATEATDAARTVARWCLADGFPAEAVTALDSCRGLVLHAATTARTVDRRLSEAGHDALADRWSQAVAHGGSAPTALRREVLDVLLSLDGSAADRLLSPPSVPEIAAALRALGRDALVYLLPAAATGSAGDAAGAAIAVASDGRVTVVPLPGLREEAEPLRAYVEHLEPTGAAPSRGLGSPVATAPSGPPGFPFSTAFDPLTAFDTLATATRRPVPERNLGGPPGRRTGTLPQRLDRLTAWAWDAVVAPLSGALGRSLPTGRTPRLVLIPMGESSAVPWHAAWCAEGDGRRYALRTVEFTYSASARLLCEVAARPARARTDAALVVGDPTGDLPFAGREALAVRDAYYPRAVFLGREDTGGSERAARPAELLRWIRSGAGRGGTLHLACHATVVGGARSSAALILHEGTLSAEDLTESVGGSDGGTHPDLVLLAACRSHVSGRGANEAYTLATAFLTAGARSVIGSLWPVPDAATSLLMFMTHHYLRVEGRQPAEALRLAQLWMLDPDRALPTGTPPGLARLVPRIVPDDLSAWAGFIATGH